MSDKLQAAVRWVAEGAGHEIADYYAGFTEHGVFPVVPTKPKEIERWSRMKKHPFVMNLSPEYEVDTQCILPGASGTLEGEVETVLGWLAKAGIAYAVEPNNSGDWQLKFYTADQYSTAVIVPYGDSLHAALESALVALHAGATGDA